MAEQNGRVEVTPEEKERSERIMAEAIQAGREAYRAALEPQAVVSNERASFTDRELRENSEAFAQRFGDNVREFLQRSGQTLQEKSIREVLDNGRPQIESDPQFKPVVDFLQGGETNAVARELGHDRKPAAAMTDREIVSEARELHAHFQQLSEKYEQAPANQRAEIREEMQPFVNRERELRQESSARLSPELSQDRVPEPQIGYGY